MKTMYLLLGAVVLFAAFVLLALFKEMHKTRKQKEKGVIPKGFGGSGGIKITGGMVILFLLLPFLSSAQGASQLQLDFSFFFVGIVVVAVLGIVYFSQPRFAYLWKEWSPVQPKTWLPFLRELWLFNLFEVFCGIVASIATASIGLFFDQKSYTSKFKR